MKFRDPEYLKEHIRRVIEFYYPTCMDAEYGGYINQLRDDGLIFDRMTKHLVGSCRFIYCFSLASIVRQNDIYREAALHGLKFLRDHHRQADGGYAWVLHGKDISDGTYHCYGHAFVLLAAAGARKADVAGADAVLDDIWALLEHRFWEPEAQLYVDEVKGGNWSAIDRYRGRTPTCTCARRCWPPTRQPETCATWTGQSCLPREFASIFPHTRRA